MYAAEELPQKAPPAFPVAEPHLFCDYGFDPEIDYFQLQQKVIEEQQRRKRGVGGIRRDARKAAAEAVRFKLQKPISKESSSGAGGKGKKRAKWWKNCIQFLKSKWTAARADAGSSAGNEARICHDGRPATPAAASQPPLPAPVAHRPPPLYTTEGSSSLYRAAPCRTTTKRRSVSWPWSPLRVAEMMPYHSLRDLGLFDDDNRNSGAKDNITGHQRLPDAHPTHMPIYLVT